MSLQTIFLATLNEGKLREYRYLLEPCGWKVIGGCSWENFQEPVESGNSFHENALLKARSGFLQSGLLTIADDSGLVVDVLGGLPGINSARWASPYSTAQKNIDKLLQYLQKFPEPWEAKFVCVIALVGKGFERLFEGRVDGKILNQRKGINGFGYDPVFFSYDLGKTFGEASLEEKMRVSHRGKATKKLIEFLMTLD